MEYRSAFEVRQQLMEEQRSASAARTTKNAPVAQASDVSAAPSGAGASPGIGLKGYMNLPDDPTALVPEIPAAENLKALNDARERDEAVQRHMERSNLSLEDSAKYIMANSSTSQQISFFSHLNESLVKLPEKRISKVLSIVLDSMWAQDPELQCKAPQDILGFLCLLNSTIAGELLEVTSTMLTVKTLAVRQEWGKLLLGLAGCLTIEQLEKEMIPLALRKSEHAEPQDQRELSCDLLGALCEFIPKDRVCALVLPKALALCQDTNVGVRQHICQQLGKVAHALGVETAKQKVAPELFELLNDEERCVSRTAFSCVTDLVKFFGPEYRKEKIYPIIKRYISHPPSEVVSLLVCEFGRFLDEIKSDITSDDVHLFANFYEMAVQRVDDESRRLCAYNMPAVAASLPLSVFPTHIAPCLNKLATDSLVEARQSIASGLHELVPILNDIAAVHLEGPFLKLLKDKDRRVRQLLFEHANILLDCFAQQLKGNQRTRFFANVASSLLHLIPECRADWRHMREVMNLAGQYQSYFDDGTLTDDFCPALLQYMKDGATVVKDDCARLVVRILAKSSNANVRVQLFSRLNGEFARSPSCYQRQSYQRCVKEICRVFSRRCLRERLLECCFEQQRDPVPMVRVALASSLPYLVRGLRSTNPGAHEEEFANMLQRLLMDSDGDVRLAARDAKERMDAADKERAIDPKRVEKEEAEDLRREKAEQAMLDLAKECDKAERRAKLRDMLKSDRDMDGDLAAAVGSSTRRPVVSPGITRGNSSKMGFSNKSQTSRDFGGSSTTSNTRLPRLQSTKTATHANQSLPGLRKTRH